MDTYALGVVLLNMLTGWKIMEKPEEIHKLNNCSLIDLINRMLCTEISNRINLQEVLEHSWVTKGVGSTNE